MRLLVFPTLAIVLLGVINSKSYCPEIRTLWWKRPAVSRVAHSRLYCSRPIFPLSSSFVPDTIYLRRADPGTRTRSNALQHESFCKNRADHSRWPCTKVARNGNKHRGYRLRDLEHRAFHGSPCCPESQRNPPPEQLNRARGSPEGREPTVAGRHRTSSLAATPPALDAHLWRPFSKGTASGPEVY